MTILFCLSQCLQNIWALTVNIIISILSQSQVFTEFLLSSVLLFVDSAYKVCDSVSVIKKFVIWLAGDMINMDENNQVLSGMTRIQNAVEMNLVTKKVLGKLDLLGKYMREGNTWIQP